MKILQYCIFAMILLSIGLMFSYCLPTPIQQGGGLSPFASLYSSNDDSETEQPANNNDDNNEETEPPGESSQNNDNDDDDDDDDEEEEEDDDEDEIDESQIPYDIRLDTMAYMTCNNGVTRDERFTFKAGAFHNGGIKLKSPIFNNKNLTDIKEYPFYRAEPFIALTRPNTPSVIVRASEFNPISFHSRLNLQSDANLRTLINVLKRNSDIYIKNLGGQHISTHHRMNNPRYLASHFDNADLFIGFRSVRQTPHFYTQEDEKYIHGRYYQIELSETEGDAQIYTLSGIDERYPKTSSRKTWNCSNRLHFKIMRHEDRRSEDEESCPDSPSNNAVYLLVKRVLKLDENDRDKWNINIAQKCISPKSRNTRCYKNNVENVDYDNCSARNVGRHCPHYLSICTR